MDSLIDLGYWGLFIGSFLASTIVPFSADLLLIGVLALGGKCVGMFADRYCRELVRGTDILLDRLVGKMEMAGTMV